MGILDNAFQAGGTWLYVTLSIGALGFLWWAVQTVLGLIGKRLPAVLWWLGPSLFVICGAGSAGYQMADALQALGDVPPGLEKIAVVRGFVVGSSILLYTGLLGTLAGLGISFGAALSNAFGAESESDWSLGLPIAGFVLTLLATGGITAWMATGLEIGGRHAIFIAALFLGGLGISLAGLRSGGKEDKPAQLQASDRVTSASGAIFGMMSAGGAMVMFEALLSLQNMARNQGSRTELFEQGLETSAQLGLIGVGAVVALMLTGALVALGAGGDLFSKHLGIDFVTCAVVLLPAFGAVGYTSYTMPSFMTTFEEILIDPGGDSDDEDGPAPPDGKDPLEMGDDIGELKDPPDRLELERK